MTTGSDHGITEVWTGVQEIISKSITVMSNTRNTFDLCTDSTGPTVTMSTPLIKEAYLDMKKRGVRVRHITEINQDNLADTIEFMKAGEVRHLEGTIGNFVVADGSNYAGAPTVEKNSISKLLVSNVSFFVQQQQYFFEMLWEKSIPARERISELKEGTKAAKIEVIRDAQVSIGLALDIMSETKKEFVVLFATPKTFIIAMKTGVAKLYSQMLANGVKIRILVPKSTSNQDLENMISEVKQIAPQIDLRLSDGDLNTKISIMVSDRKQFVAWELRDDSNDNPYEAGGVATYSTSEAIASSYATIFDNLWNITDMAENLAATNLKLHESQNAMKEFINIAAHELRTPIQPILGLAGILAEKNRGRTDVEGGDGQLLDVIVRNAKRLQEISEKILDVTKIESGSMHLAKKQADVAQTLKMAVEEANIQKDSRIKLVLILPKQEQLLVLIDNQRIHQVLHNLLGNAIKFTEEGTITVTAEKKDQDVVVQITDCGQGIDSEILPKLFSKFATKSDQGTGLGLFISKSIVEAHGGKIWAQNNSNGKGATFAFSLPIFVAAPDDGECQQSGG